MPVVASKNTVVEVILAALETTQLRDVGMDALRAVLSSDPRLSILDGILDLTPVWEVISHQQGFDVALATPALCYVKLMEERLGVAVRLPGPLEILTSGEIRASANNCRPAPDTIDRILRGFEQARAQEGEAGPSKVGRLPIPRKKLLTMIGSAVALVVSALFIYSSIAGHVQRTPTFRPLDAGEFAGDLPILGARIWANEVHATLGDPTWVRQPESRKRQQLEQALDRLAARKATTLIIEDEGGNKRAAAQFFGQPRRVQVRFY